MLTEFAHRLVLMLCRHLRDVFEAELLTSTCFASHPPPPAPVIPSVQPIHNCMVHCVRRLRPVHGLGMIPADKNRHVVQLDAAGLRRFPMRGHTVTAHQGVLYVIGGKLQGGKDASSHIHMLSLPHVLNGRPALKASVEVSFKIWDHAACLLPPSPVMPHGCICVVAGRAASKLGFSNQAFLINLDPNRFDVLSVPIKARNGSKTFVVRSGCALLPHPHVPNAIILHGGRTAPGVGNGKPHTTTNGAQTILSDWHLLTLSSQHSTSARSKALVMESAELQCSPSVQQSDLSACKHCLCPLGSPAASSKGAPLHVLVCGGSAALEQRPLATVEVNIKSMHVSLQQTSTGDGAAAAALTSAVCCAGAPGAQGSNHGLFLVPIRKPQPAVVVCVVTSSGGGLCRAEGGGGGGGGKWSIAQQRTLPSPPCDTLTPLCVASAAAVRPPQGGGAFAGPGQGLSHRSDRNEAVVVVAQGQAGGKHPTLYVWADPALGGQVSSPALHPAAARGCQDQQMSSYTGDYALPDSDPIRIEDLHVAPPACTAAKHGVSAPASTAGASKRKSNSTAAAAASVDTKRRRSSAPVPAAAAATGQGRHCRSVRATNGLLTNRDTGAPVSICGRTPPRNGGAAVQRTTPPEMKAAQQQVDMNGCHVVQETPEESMHDDLHHDVTRGCSIQQGTGAGGATAAAYALDGGRGRPQTKRAVAVQQNSGVLVPEAEVQKLRERAQVAVRLESEVVSLQQTLEERMQHGHKCDGQMAALRRQVSDLEASLAREKACAAEARGARDAAAARESESHKRFSNAAQQSEEEVGRLTAEVAALQRREREGGSCREKLLASLKRAETELSLAQAARAQDTAALQTQCSELAREKEECAAQNQKLQGQNAALEEECGKLRAGAEQHLLQVEAARERLQAADKKLEEEEQRRLQEVKELQEHHKGHVSSLENHLRLEGVNRDTVEARHKGELQKYLGRLAYLEEVAKMCQEGAEVQTKRADGLAEELDTCKAKLQAAEEGKAQLQDTCAAHHKAAERAQEAVKALQGELGTLRAGVAQQKQQLQEAHTKIDEHKHAIAEGKAQIVQLQKEKDEASASRKQLQQDLMHAAAERQKVIESLAAGQAALSAAQKHEAEAFSKFTAGQPAAAAAPHNG